MGYIQKRNHKIHIKAQFILKQTYPHLTHSFRTSQNTPFHLLSFPTHISTSSSAWLSPCSGCGTSTFVVGGGGKSKILISCNIVPMSRKGGGAALPKDVPWRASPAGKPIPKIHHSPVLRISQNPHSNYALSVMKHPNPVGSGLAIDAIVEAAGPECIVPGQITPVKLLGLKVWPIDVNLKFMEPVGRELKLLGKFMDSAVNLMNQSFTDR